MADSSVERHALRSMGLLLWYQDRHEEAAELGELALDRRLQNRDGEIGSLANLGQLYRAMGRYDEALEYLERALTLERSMDRRLRGLVVKESYIMQLIGSIYSALGDHEKARQHLEAAQASVGTTISTANVVQQHFNLTALARLTLREGRVEEALDLYREATDLCRRTRHMEGLPTSLRLLGEMLLNLDRHEEALPNLEEAAEMYEGMRDRTAAALMRRGVAVAREALGQRDRALDAWEKTREIAESIEDSSLQLEAAEGVGRLLKGVDSAGALRAYEGALELARSVGATDKIGGYVYSIGTLRWGLGAYDEALRDFEAAYDALVAAGLSGEAGLALNSIGRTLRDLGRLEEAKTRLVAATEFNQRNGETLLEAHALATLGDVHLDAGEPSEAAARFTAALDLRKTLDDEPG